MKMIRVDLKSENLKAHQLPAELNLLHQKITKNILLEIFNAFIGLGGNKIYAIFRINATLGITMLVVHGGIISKRR